MKLALRSIISMSNDPLLSDKMFRDIVRKLATDRKRKESTIDVMNRLRQEAIFEAERDKYVS